MHTHTRIHRHSPTHQQFQTHIVEISTTRTLPKTRCHFLSKRTRASMRHSIRSFFEPCRLCTSGTTTTSARTMQVVRVRQNQQQQLPLSSMFQRTSRPRRDKSSQLECTSRTRSRAFCLLSLVIITASVDVLECVCIYVGLYKCVQELEMFLLCKPSCVFVCVIVRLSICKCVGLSVCMKACTHACMCLRGRMHACVFLFF